MLLPPPLSVRRGVPFYHAKSEAEVSLDVYERYDSLVTRQTALHLCDQLHGGYPFQPLLNFVTAALPAGDGLTVVDLGCSVGRLAGELARANPTWTVYGVDLSYQMLRQATDVWVRGQATNPNLTGCGWGVPELAVYRLPNVHFALARAGDLPFPDHSLDVVINTFLIDRLPDPLAAFAEWARVLKPGGRVISASPLNFLSRGGWIDFHPPVRLLHTLQQRGWEVADWLDPLELFEPLDARGNAVRWRTIAMVLTR